MIADNTARAVRRLTLAILLALAAYALANNMIGVTMNDIIDEFSLSGAGQGLMASMISVGGMAALFCAPLLQGRASKFWVIALSGVVQFLALMLTGVTPNMPVLLAACVLLGAFGSMIDIFTNSYIVDLHKADSTRYLAVLHGCYGLGSLLTPLLLVAILARWNWRASYFVIAGMTAALMAAFVVLGVRNRHRAAVRELAPEHKLSFTMLREYISSRSNLSLLAASALYAASQTGIVGWVVRYMTLRFGAAELGSVSMSVFWICATLSRFGAARLRIPPMKLYIGGGALAAVAHALGVVSGSPVGMLIACGAVGLLSGHSIPVLLGVAANQNPGRTTLVTSAMLFAMSVGRMLMPLLMGAVTTSVSVSTAMLLPALAAALTAVCGWLAARARA